MQNPCMTDFFKEILCTTVSVQLIKAFTNRTIKFLGTWLFLLTINNCLVLKKTEIIAIFCEFLFFVLLKKKLYLRNSTSLHILKQLLGASPTFLDHFLHHIDHVARSSTGGNNHFFVDT